MSRRGFDRLAWRPPRPSAPIIHLAGALNRGLLLPHLLRLRAFDLPEADRARLAAAVNPATAAFLAPNHPEFMTDWMIDKEISRRVSPLMAHWASYEVVNIHPVAQWVWLRNNLIANVPGGGGREWSVRWALAGHGVLLHPEGAPSWHGDRVGALVPGVIDMAWETARAIAAEGGSRPVSVVPIVWKLHFTRDVGAELEREIARIERRLGLPAGPAAAPLERRFAALQEAVLARSLARHGAGSPATAVPSAGPATFFTRQEAHAEALRARLEARHGRGEGEGPRRLHALRRAIATMARDDREGARRDREVLLEIERLRHFTAADYGGATLTQEQIAESLKQVRLGLPARGAGEAVHGVVPVAVAPRVVRVRVPAPLDVSAAFARGGDEAATRDELRASLHTRLQEGLDRLNAEIEPEVGRWRRDNPFRLGA